MDGRREVSALERGPARGAGRGRRVEAYEIKFFAVILGVRTPAPRIDDPVTQIPLQNQTSHDQLPEMPVRSNSTRLRSKWGARPLAGPTELGTATLKARALAPAVGGSTSEEVQGKSRQPGLNPADARSAWLSRARPTLGSDATFRARPAKAQTDNQE